MVPWNHHIINAFPDPYLLSPRPTKVLPSHSTDNLAPPPPPPTPAIPFPFFSLPPEIRNRIYALVLFTTPPYRSSGPLRPGSSRIPLFLVSRRFHIEASYLLYSSQPFRIFPLQDFNPIPTIGEIPVHYRNLVQTLELVLGQRWTSPPSSWMVNKPLTCVLSGLAALTALSIFVEIDPSHPVFAKFGVSHDFYTDFSGDLLRDLLDAMPQLKAVQIEARPSVRMDSPLVTRLRKEAEEKGKIVRLGILGTRDEIGSAEEVVDLVDVGHLNAGIDAMHE